MYTMTWLASAVLLHVLAAEETCHFPDFLQSSPAEGSIKSWTTMMWWMYLRHAPKWSEKQDIYVKNGQMWRHREMMIQNCESSARKVYHNNILDECIERQLVHNRTCIREEGLNTYRVIEYNADRTHRFTCMKFVKRSNTVIQVYEGPVSSTNDPDLCDSAGLRLDEWPWTAPRNNEPGFCLLSGGFIFRTIRRLTNEDFCEDEWRWSLLEIECVKGDGIDFITPKDSNCNPFLKQGHWKRLTCWAGWEYNDYIFILAADEDNYPNYCLRFPRVQEGEFSVLLYFSVICPVEQDGKPPPGLEYYELRMIRKDKASCRDENADKCSEIITSEDMCNKDTVYAPHCPKSCGRCSTSTVSDINRRRCWINPTLYGDWRLSDSFITAEVTINKEKAVFSHLGAFQCLDMDTKGQRYKMASLFENGCSVRYTCMEFIRRNNNVLQYRISSSKRSETEMDELCTFQDDLPPLLDSYRSENFKNLILTNNLWPSYCGLQSTIPFNGTINGQQCSGIISDWNEKKCNLVGTISLQSKTCGELVLPVEYQCIAFIHDDALPYQQLLLTRSLDGKETYNCWVLTSHAGSVRWPQRVLYQMPTAQCSLAMGTGLWKAPDYVAALSLDDRARSKICKPVEPRQRAPHSSINKSVATDQSYIIPNQDEAANSDIEVRIESPPFKAPPSEIPPINTDPTFWGVYGNGNIIRGILCQNISCMVLMLIYSIFLYKTLYR